MTDAANTTRSALTALLGRGVPSDTEAEAMLLGTLICTPGELVAECAAIVQPEHFWSPGHKALYSAIVDLHDARGEGVDLVAVDRLMKERGHGDWFTPAKQLEITEASWPPSATVNAKKIRDAARLRGLVEIGHEIMLRADAKTLSGAGEQIEHYLDRLMKLADDAGGQADIEDLSAGVDEVVSEIETRMVMTNPPPLGIPIGLYDVDRMLCGLEHGTVTIIAARTSVGKTSLAMQIAQHVSATSCKAGVFCLEMNRKQLIYRQLAVRSGISAMDLRHAQIRDRWQSLVDAAAALKRYPIDASFCPGLTMPQLRALATRMVRRNVGHLTIDHLGLMRTPRAENRNLALGEITRGVKALAAELHVPIVLLSQLNRKAEDRERPSMADLRESGHIEEDADNILLIHRPEFKERQKPGYSGDPLEPCEIIIDKNRQGPTGIVEALFDCRTMRFVDKSAPFKGAGEAA